MPERSLQGMVYGVSGHGESAAPPVPSLALFSAQLRELLDPLGIAGGALVGFSLGGMISSTWGWSKNRRASPNLC